VIKTFHARGGIGEVFRAEDREIGREVALKRLRDPAAQHDRFLAEAQVAGQLEHPGIVPVHDLGTDADGHPFYVMKLVHGRTLKEAIAAYHAHAHAQPQADAPAPEVARHRLLETFVTLCQAIAYAHDRGVVHRDLKPENVMVGRFGETIVLDWGLAKVVGHPYVQGGTELVHLPAASGSTPTVAGAYMGSPPYMSPELAEGHADDADERTDVYLLGATLYEILTGRPPRTGSSRDEIIELARTVDPVPPRQVKAEVPRALEAVCLKAMARRKQDRYPGALTLAEEIQRYLAGEPVSVCPEGPVARAWRWCKRHSRAIERAAAAVLVLALIVLALVALHRAQQRKQALAALRAFHSLDKQARAAVGAFHSLADQAHFFAASTLPDDERAPYYDISQAESKAKEALAKVEPWGPGLTGLPSVDEPERDYLRNESYDLLLLLVQIRIPQRSGPDASRDLLPLLDRAGRLHEPTRAYHRLRSMCLAVVGDRATAAAEQARADDAKTPAIALDHFLDGETLRTQSGASDELTGAEPDRDRLAQAVEAYRKALELDPGHYWSRFQMGRCYLALGHRPEAVEALGGCIAVRPDAPWGYSARGLALALEQRYDEALRDLDRAIALGSRPAQLNRGVVFKLQQKFDQALADFEAVLQPPDDRRLIEAAYYRGVIELQRGRYLAAETEFNRALAANPGLPHVYLARARLDLLRGNLARGRDDFNRYLSLTRGAAFDLEGSEAYRLWGRFLRLRALDAPQEKQQTMIGLWALAELQKAIDHGDRAPVLYQDRGAVLDAFELSQQAIAAYTQALSLVPGHVETLVRRGWVYNNLGNLAEAKTDFTEAIRLDPDHAEAHAGLGYVSARQGAIGVAQQEALQVLLLRDKVHHKSDYFLFHNAACIYAVLALAVPNLATQYQDQAIDLLERAIALWRRRGDGPSEIDAIKGEPAFRGSLWARPEFQKLIQ
jgi:tetratricopeptide (TPR) repeat protein/tRNA A-37 threonylcarbamoyl transferase component Bud32